MPRSLWSGNESRKIIARIVVEGDLVLQTPAHFGNGDTDDLTDMPLLVDPFDGKTPLLTGATITGALRSYLREREHGYEQLATRQSACVSLFGGLKGDEEGEQSTVIVEDALGKNFGIEMRDGVRLDGKTRTATNEAKFDLQLWKAGTTFPLRFELVLRESDDANVLKRALATALSGFNDGGITLGARKHRGYGQAHVSQWRVTTHDLTTTAGLLRWLEQGERPLDDVTPQTDIKQTLGIGTLIDDHRQMFCVNATFSLDGSLLIRSGSGQDDQGPDMAHLQARQANGEKKPILSGTSLGGALRARALMIGNTLDTSKRARALIDEVFGVEIRPGVQPSASRISVQEHAIQNAKTDLVQNRVSIDRFTGGARDGALFNEQPAFGDDDTTVTMDIYMVNPKSHEIGLLLLLLKDLWTSDLPVGGESSVGRGRLKGKEATLTYRSNGTPLEWKIVANRHGLAITGHDRDALENYVSALSLHLKGPTHEA
jgi:CRISPR/Cas system CSM-associated protein Csm3 (group 7 of RAMP superfamily)